MKKGKNLLLFVMLVSVCGAAVSCKTQKYGCPSNGRNVGAERILSGEKVPKATRFKA